GIRDLPVTGVQTCALPILLLASYGDLASSRLVSKPVGREPVVTRVLPLDRLDEVLEAVGRALARGERLFWVCPVIEASEAADTRSEERRVGKSGDLGGGGS